MVTQSLDARRLVFVDEMGTNISLSPLYGWALRGERALCSVPRNRGANTTVLSSMSAEGMGASLITVEGATTLRWSSKLTWSRSLHPRYAQAKWWC